MLGCVSSVFHRFIFTEVETVETDRVNVPKSVCFLVNHGVRSCARASLAFYNTTADIDRFLAALGGVRKEMGYAE